MAKTAGVSRRWLPVFGVVASVGAAVVQPWIVPLAPLMSYVAGYRVVRWWCAVAAVAAIMTGMPFLVWAMRPADGFHPDLSLQLLVIVVLPGLIGRYRRQRVRLQALGEESTRR